MTEINTVHPDELFEWLGSGEAILVDVREPAEHRAEFIDAATNITLGQAISDFSQYKNKKIVMYCQSGRRATIACKRFKAKESLADLCNLQGGIIAWKKSGLPVQTSGKHILPLDRQVQLTLGLIILLGATLGYSVAIIWLILPMIIGLGLINAGLTGWCGLAKVIAKMPWNQ